MIHLLLRPCHSGTLVLCGGAHTICQDYNEMLPGNKVIAGVRQDKLIKQEREGSCLICDGNIM